MVGAGTEQRLVAVGRLSDGSTRDMTREVRYFSSDEAVTAVSPAGIATAVAPGMATVTARAMGKVATSQFGVVEARAGSDFPAYEPRNFIDEAVGAKLRQMNVRPTDLAGDREFARRVHLDTIGLLPTPEELRAFLSDTRPDKRALLIDSLLERPEHASLWTVKFEDWFRNCQLHSQGRSMGVFKDWVRDWLAEDRPYDEFVRALLTSRGDTMLNPAANFWHPATDFMLKEFSVNKVTPTVTRLFLGVRMECAECHNHPLENFTQDDFYGFAAFFARLRVKHGYGEYRRTWFLDEAGEIEHPATKTTASRAIPRRPRAGNPGRLGSTRSPGWRTGLCRPTIRTSPGPPSIGSGTSTSALASWSRSMTSARRTGRRIRNCWTASPPSSGSAATGSSRCTG